MSEGPTLFLSLSISHAQLKSETVSGACIDHTCAVVVGPWLYRRSSTTRYAAVQERMTFDNALLACQTELAGLASVSSLAEQSYLVSMLVK